MPSFVFHLPSPISNYLITFSFVVVQLPGYKLLFSRMSLDWTSIDYPLHQSKERKQLSGTQVAHWYACFCTRQLHLFLYVCNLYWCHHSFFICSLYCTEFWGVLSIVNSEGVFSLENKILSFILTKSHKSAY